MKILFVNPPTLDNQKFIREGRCMQSVNSWAAIWPPLTLAILATIAKKYSSPIPEFQTSNIVLIQNARKLANENGRNGKWKKMKNTARIRKMRKKDGAKRTLITGKNTVKRIRNILIGIKTGRLQEIITAK